MFIFEYVFDLGLNDRTRRRRARGAAHYRRSCGDSHTFSSVYTVGTNEQTLVWEELAKEGVTVDKRKDPRFKPQLLTTSNMEDTSFRLAWEAPSQSITPIQKYEIDVDPATIPPPKGKKPGLD